jgi:YHS domain-containing protein
MSFRANGSAGSPRHMIRSFFVDFVFPVLLFLVLRSLIGGFFRARAQQRRADRPAAQPQVTPGGELKKDPVCGTYVSTTAAITRSSNGQTVYFCSKECASKYNG